MSKLETLREKIGLGKKETLPPAEPTEDEITRNHLLGLKRRIQNIVDGPEGGTMQLFGLLHDEEHLHDALDSLGEPGVNLKVTYKQARRLGALAVRELLEPLSELPSDHVSPELDSETNVASIIKTFRSRRLPIVLSYAHYFDGDTEEHRETMVYIEKRVS